MAKYLLSKYHLSERSFFFNIKKGRKHLKREERKEKKRNYHEFVKRISKKNEKEWVI